MSQSVPTPSVFLGTFLKSNKFYTPLNFSHQRFYIENQNDESIGERITEI